ncbi:DEAD/DEAH box helicase [Sinomicrobium sp. M5D2P17]
MKQQDILQFWRDVEIFNLPDFNKDSLLLEVNADLPWFKENRPGRKNYKWRYTLIFGKIDKKVIVEHLNNLLKIEAVNDWEEPVTGFSCLSALILDEKGCPQYDSYITASYTFGIRALEQNKKLSTVPEALERSKEDFYDRYGFIATDNTEELPQGEVVVREHLKREIDYLENIIGWWKQDIKIYILEELVPKDSEPNTGFLNSFFLDDLNYLSSIKQNQLGIALQSYLTLNPSIEKRKDLIKNKELLFQTIDPGLMTAGRWPSKIEYGLYSAQAGAVNTIFSNLKGNEGLQGVNGPPGTGKTTLLLDIIAGIIVERAKVISDLGCNALFESGYRKIEKESGYDRYTYNLKEALQGDFGIVVASNNNAAVENISKELPLKSKIDTSTFPDADYFSDCSQSIIDDESWGALAAALGNAKNRNAFREAFWQSKKDTEEIRFNDLLYNIYRDPENDQTFLHRKSFNIQSKKLKSLLKEFDAFKKTASSFHKQLPEYISNIEKKEQRIAEITRVEARLSDLSTEEKSLLEKENTTRQDADRLQSLLNLQMQRKPSFFFFQKLFSTSNFKKWNSEAEELINKLKSINSILERIRKELAMNNDSAKVLHSEQEKNKSDLSELDMFVSEYKKLQEILCKEYGIETRNLFNIEFLQKKLEEIHLLNPYHSPKIAKLRSDIFITATRLHHDAILANAKSIRNNLTAFFEMISGWVTVDSKMSQNLWDTFFLCVPVASTTLASASRLFPKINKGQIGWLLIDEAGQATPQSVAGLIHRSKRCVIVGDPLQVEPVVTIPKKLVTKLRNEHRVEVGWSPHKVSVQQLADKASYLGTYMDIGNSEERIWAGFPLRAHRRCDDPMFTIVNEIAYSNQMVNAVPENSTTEFIGVSKWFHVECSSTPYKKHVIPEEVDVLKNKISDLLQTGYVGKIYVISPFKSVADFCLNEFKSQKNISCGTIHKFQGKEADIVFLVLGGNPKSPGARNWASQKPNMLNVALTRAKKRFYVIGNKKLWGPCKYFSTMAGILDY